MSTDARGLVLPLTDHITPQERLQRSLRLLACRLEEQRRQIKIFQEALANLASANASLLDSSRIYERAIDDLAKNNKVIQEQANNLIKILSQQKY